MATTVNTNDLLEWFQDPTNRCYFNFDLLSVKKSPISSGVGVFAKKTQNPIPANEDVEENNLLLRVHKSMVLSSQTSTISNLLYEYKLSGMYGLVLSFIYEKQLGSKSPWFIYLNSINYKDNKNNLILPLCLYSENEKKILKGTEIEFMGGLDSIDLKNHFKISCEFAKNIENILPIPNCLNEETGFNEFSAITMAIASRAFEIDNFIELGLVPGADLFNHDANGLENVHFVTLGEVCPYCGKEEGCWHEDFGPPDSEDEENEEEEEIDDELMEDIKEEIENNEEMGKEKENNIEQIEEITMDYIENMEKELKEEKEKEEAEKREEEGNDSDDDNDDFDYREFYLNPDECCDIVLERKIVKNKEIFNTYGELPNAVLLVKYGFAVEDNIYDSICLGPQIVNYKKEHPEVEEKIDWWSCMGWILLREQEKAEEEDDEEADEEADEEDDEDDENDMEEEDEEEEGESWLYQCRIEHPGKANKQLTAVSRLLTLSTEEFEDMIGDEDCDGEMIMKKLVNAKGSKESKTLLKKWIQERQSNIGGGKSNIGDIKKQLKKCDPNSIRYKFNVAVLNELKLLKNALNNIK